MIKAVINLEAPRDHVFAILTDYPKYTKWLPGCEQANITSSSGNAVDTEIVINSMKKMKLGLRFEAHPTQSLLFRMISGKDMKSYSGSYRFMDAADGHGTVVIAEMEIDVGAMVPKFMVDRIAKKSIDDTGNALRQYVKSVPAIPSARPAAAAKPAGTKPKRARRVMQILKTPSGYQVWIVGESYDLTQKSA